MYKYIYIYLYIFTYTGIHIYIPHTLIYIQYSFRILFNPSQWKCCDIKCPTLHTFCLCLLSWTGQSWSKNDAARFNSAVEVSSFLYVL